MTDQLTDNETIALFMGWRIEGEPEFIKPYEIWISETGARMYPRTDPQGNKYPEKFEFHTSWNWLMPVWYKFKELKYPVRSSLASGQFYSLFLDYQRQIVKAITHSGPSPSEACKLLAEGIRWYNSIKTQKA